MGTSRPFGRPAFADTAIPMATAARALGDDRAELLAKNLLLTRDLYEARYREAHHRQSAFEAVARERAFRSATPAWEGASGSDVAFEAARLHLARISAREPLSHALLAATHVQPTTGRTAGLAEPGATVSLSP